LKVAESSGITTHHLASLEIKALSISRLGASVVVALVEVRPTVGVANVDGDSSRGPNALVGFTLVLVTGRSGARGLASIEGRSDISGSDLREGNT